MSNEKEIYGKEAMVDAIYEEIKNTEGLPASVQNLSKKAIGTVLDLEKSLIVEAVANGDKIRYIGFGNYELRERQARKGRNPQSGETIDIAATSVPYFKPGKDFKNAVRSK